MEKEHQTVTITMTKLANAGACYAAREALKHHKLLPATLSTDPDDNLDLAFKLVTLRAYPNYPANAATCSRWLPWFAQNMGSEDANQCQYLHSGCFFEERAGSSCGENDPTVVAQMLAMIADAICEREGR